jgi:hypothetical protein
MPEWSTTGLSVTGKRTTPGERHPRHPKTNQQQKGSPPPVNGPFLFDTSAESRLARDPAGSRWLFQYASRYLVYVSAVTVLECLTGFGLAID